MTAPGAGLLIYSSSHVPFFSISNKERLSSAFFEGALRPKLLYIDVPTSLAERPCGTRVPRKGSDKPTSVSCSRYLDRKLRGPTRCANVLLPVLTLTPSCSFARYGPQRASRSLLSGQGNQVRGQQRSRSIPKRIAIYQPPMYQGQVTKFGPSAAGIASSTTIP